MAQLILASASPRRAELLKMLGISFTVCPAAIDEAIRPGEEYQDYALRVAQEKAAAIFKENGNTPVLGADTVVVWKEKMFCKPKDREDAAAMLRQLADSWHKVLTGVHLITADKPRSLLNISRVRFGSISEPSLARYLDTGEYQDKSGSYGIQGPAAAFIRCIEGSHTGIMGLPLCETAQMLQEAGLQSEKVVAAPGDTKSTMA